MVKASIQIAFEGESRPATVTERKLEVQVPRNPQGEQNVGEHLSFELIKEMTLGGYYDQLPETEGIWNATTMKFTLDHLATQEYFNRVNTHWVWFEISNILQRAKYLLAQSRASREAELSLQGNPDETLLLNLHFRKMDYFDLAVFLLAKVQDLFLRLLYENLSASLVPIRPDERDWERLLTRDNIRGGLKKRAENPDLAELNENEYQEIKRIFDCFANPHFVQKFIGYRDRLAHRFTPSVDYPGLAAPVEDRRGTPITDSTGKRTGTSWGFGGGWRKIDYEFLDLYENTVKTMKHWISLLKQLKNISRFNP